MRIIPHSWKNRGRNQTKRKKGWRRERKGIELALHTLNLYNYGETES